MAERLDNIKIITEQNFGSGRLVIVPQEAKYQFRNDSENHSFHLNFNKPWMIRKQSIIIKKIVKQNPNSQIIIFASA